MFETYVPRHRIGYLSPLSIIENAAYEFYRLAPPGTILVAIPIGLNEFSNADVERVFRPLEGYLDQLLKRRVDVVIQSGAPLPLLIGMEAHDRMIDRIASYTGKPATSTVLAAVRAAKALGLKKIALANKWSDVMNDMLGRFFNREGVTLAGIANKSLDPSQFTSIGAEDHMTLAYSLGRRALAENADADGLYLGGGTWLTEPVVKRLEDDFGKPVICNQTATVREVLTLLDDWRPTHGHSRLMAAP